MVEGKKLDAWLGRIFASVWRPRDRSAIADWGRANISLDSTESADFQGPYDPDLNPLPTVLFEAYESGKYRRLIFKKSSQSGVTLAVLVFMCWFVVNICRNLVYVITNREEARDISALRFQPMIRNCKAARKLGRILSEKMTNLACQFAGCVAYFRGADSKGGLANKSAGVVIYDEVDTYPFKKSDKEKASELGKERGKRQTKFVEILLSKPADWDDTTNQEYLSGTRHKCFCPCPHCGTMQEIEWERIKFKHLEAEAGGWQFERFEKEVYLECISEECQASPMQGRIYENAKPAMITAREWRQTNFGEDGIGPVPEVFSCEITDLYSTFPGITWGSIAQEFCASLGDPVKLETFFRGRLARPTKKKKIQVDSSNIFSMTGRYKRGQIPAECDAILMASDVQKVPPVKKWMKAGFRLSDDACFVSDWGEFLSFEDLVKEAKVPVEVLQWNRFTPAAARIHPQTRAGLIDERHEPGMVRDFVTSTFQGLNANGVPVYQWHSCRGWGGIHARRLRDVVTPGLDSRPNAAHNGFPLWVYDLSDDHFKDLLYNVRINGHSKRVAAEAAGLPPPADIPLTMFPAMLDPDMVAELCQERYVYDPHTRRWGWEDPKGANDFGDALKYLLVLWYLLKPVIAMEKAAALPRAA